VQIDGQTRFHVLRQPDADRCAGALRHEHGISNRNGVSNSAGTWILSLRLYSRCSRRFFASAGYVAATALDGSIITAAAPAKPGQIISLYGTGFGATTPTMAAGALVQTVAPLSNPVIVNIGGATASVSWGGLSGAGLYQFNLEVPKLADGDYEVIAHIANLQSPTGVLCENSELVGVAHALLRAVSTLMSTPLPGKTTA